MKSAPLKLERYRRQELERVIEGLIALLDALDGDADLEDGIDREDDPAENGLADFDALDLFLAEGGIASGLRYDGSGVAIAVTHLRRIFGPIRPVRERGAA